MVYRAPLYITPTSLTNLTVFVESDIGNGIHKILTLDDFTLDNDKLKYNGVGYSVEATYKIYSSGYVPETVSVSSADTGTGVEVALTSVSDYSKTSDGTNTYYVKDAYARDLCSDIVDMQNVIVDAQSTLADDTLSNVSSINSNSAVQTALNGKVSKAGDTMTGDLTVVKSTDNHPVTIQANDVTLGTVPNTDAYCGLSITDSNGDMLGYLYADAMADGRRRIRLNTKNLDGSTSTNFTLGFTANGTAYCSFPDTSRCDGQWIANNQSIIDTVSLNGSSNLNKTVTLPNDGSKYEVLFSCSVTSGSTSGDYAHVILNSSRLNAGVNVCYARARTNATVTASGNIIIPMEYGSNNLTITRSTNYTGTGTVAVRAYRRIGTNS